MGVIFIKTKQIRFSDIKLWTTSSRSTTYEVSHYEPSNEAGVSTPGRTTTTTSRLIVFINSLYFSVQSFCTIFFGLGASRPMHAG